MLTRHRVEDGKADRLRAWFDELAAREATDESEFDDEHRAVVDDVLVDGGGEEFELLGHFTNPER